MKISFHTDAFNISFVNFDRCLEWARDNDVHWIECGLIDGVSWIHGLGYQPHVAMYQDPALLRKHMEKFGVRFSQVDAAFPLSGLDGPASMVRPTACPMCSKPSRGRNTPAANGSPPPMACTARKGSPTRRRWT